MLSVLHYSAVIAMFKELEISLTLRSNGLLQRVINKAGEYVIGCLNTRMMNLP